MFQAGKRRVTAANTSFSLHYKDTKFERQSQVFCTLFSEYFLLFFATEYTEFFLLSPLLRGVRGVLENISLCTLRFAHDTPPPPLSRGEIGLCIQILPPYGRLNDS